VRRAELEHAIRAATEIIAEDEVVVIGSQAILGTLTEDELPVEATQSVEVDMVPLGGDDAGALATKLDAFLGEWSGFHQRFGYYVQGVGMNTAVLPDGWQDRLVRLSNSRTGHRTGLCLDPHDLCLAKLAAHREKDLTFAHALVRGGLIDLDVLVQRLNDMTTADPRASARIKAWIESARRKR
jgi:hypothetical protein